MNAFPALKTVTTAGTPVALASTSTPCCKIRIEARNDATVNTGKIWVGTSALVKATGVGVIGVLPIPAVGNVNSPFIEIDGGDDGNQLDAAGYAIDSAVNGEGAFVTYWVR